jgi:hypothetical protein
MEQTWSSRPERANELYCRLSAAFLLNVREGAGGSPVESRPGRYAAVASDVLVPTRIRLELQVLRIGGLIQAAVGLAGGLVAC